jgi:hypothetical protein
MDDYIHQPARPKQDANNIFQLLNSVNALHGGKLQKIERFFGK